MPSFGVSLSEQAERKTSMNANRVKSLKCLGMGSFSVVV
ncbi:hypothetical protein FM109_02660 [Vibrio casei]|nr:hypothetical protein FM109_02660 [Vibrio casei]